MRAIRFRYGLLAIAAVLVLATAAWAAEPMEYELRFDRPNTHLIAISIRATGLRGPAAEFAIPAWAPGAYHINDYAMSVQEFSATTPDGRPLAWRKTDKQTWRVELAGSTAVAVRYRLFGNTLSNISVQYNDRHAHIPGPAAWMYLVGGKERPVRLKIDVPASWRVATGMPRAGENTFTAPDYDWLADSPIEISDFREQTFTVAGTTYHVVVHDILAGQPFSRLTADTKKIVETIVPAYAAVAGDAERQAPFSEYWFLFHIWPRSGGGLEHLNSTQINFSSDWKNQDASGRFGTDYDLKLFVTSHEFYHAWNVKRLRPRPLGPFDYTREVYSPSLWISEGLTSYYGQLALVRAGLVTLEAYLNSIGQLITELENDPGRRERSIEQTSWDTWFRFTGSAVENNQANTMFSYYDGGQVMGHLLDFAIRQATNNQKSLDDWMRLLYQRYALPKPGFEPEEAVRAASEVAGKDLSDFFRCYLQGKEVPPYAEYFAYAGISVEKRVNPETPWLGASWQKNEDGRARILNIFPGSPAEQSGLDRGEVIVAVGGQTVNADEFLRTLASSRPGETVRVTVIHDGAPREVEVKLGADSTVTYILKPMEEISDSQRTIYRSWLGLK